MALNILVNSITNPYISQDYEDRDINLISNYSINQKFNNTSDYIELFVYDKNDNLIVTDYQTLNYYADQVNPKTNDGSGIVLDPGADLPRYGIDRGSFNVNYKFYKRLFNSSFVSRFWISEISLSRTELRLKTQFLNDVQLLQQFQEFEIQRENNSYYPDFLINFGDNKTVIATNIAYSEDDEGQASILIKLYKPLPLDFNVKDTLWLVNEVSEPVTYNVTFVIDEDTVAYPFELRGPNYNVDEVDQIGLTTPLYNLSEILTTTYNSSSYNQVLSLLEEKGIDINVDYSDFSQFVHFSSVVQRLLNFKYKIELIESYEADIISLDSIVNNETYVSTSKKLLQDKINNLIEKFDGYEYYLYYESGSMTWPKYETEKPYTLYSATSSIVSNWLGGVEILPTPTTQSVLFLAQEYDINNQDYFLNSIPEYLREDSDNIPYEIFLDMIGQHFDNIWLFQKDVTNRYKAYNDINQGVSKDMVADSLKALGLKLYTNTNISDNIYYSLLGYNENGSLYTATGSESISYYITSSVSGISSEDITLENYKRIYHNIPYLLKSKGTERGLRALINCFGIPDTILNISEFGGSTKTEGTNNYVDNRFALAYRNTYTENLTFPWAPSYYQNLNTGNSNITPDTIEFRFKSIGVPTSSQYYTQSLFTIHENNAGASGSLRVGIRVMYNPNISLADSPYEKYGDIQFALSENVGGPVYSDKIYLPIFDEDKWWTVMLKRETGGATAINNSYDNTYSLYVKNAGFNEEGIYEIMFQGSSSISVNGTTDPNLNGSWNQYNPALIWSFNAYLGGNNNGGIFTPNGTNFDGYFQEFRYWATPLEESTFDVHVLNSLSYVGNGFNSSSIELIYRAPLGNNLNVPFKDEYEVIRNNKDYDLYLLGLTTIDECSVLSSYHPAVGGATYIESIDEQFEGIPSFINGPLYSYGLFGSNNNKIFEGVEFTDIINVPSIGLSQKINRKITTNNALISSSNPFKTHLHPEANIQELNDKVIISPQDIEVGFSPTNIIDGDIINQFGYFNIDQYIGNPADQYELRYLDLKTLRTRYMHKYASSFEISDIIRGIKFLDNSLFKMIKDFVPVKASVSSGIIIKPGLLERNKYRRYLPEISEILYTSSIDMISIEGSNPVGKDLTTSYTQSIQTLLGIVSTIKDDGRELITGEFGEGTIQAVTGEFEQVELSNNYDSLNYLYIENTLDPLLNNVTSSRLSNNKFFTDNVFGQIVPNNIDEIQLMSSYLKVSGSPLLIQDYQTNMLADIQDYNYSATGLYNSRYGGVKLLASKINEYSSGDVSYGLEPVIDLNQIYFGYTTTMYRTNMLLPLRSNMELKYLIDENENVIDLTKNNENLFAVQNTYKSGELINISLFSYSSSYQQKLDKNIRIFESGFKYVPIMHNVLSASVSMSYDFFPPIEDVTVGQATTTVPGYDTDNYEYTVYNTSNATYGNLDFLLTYEVAATGKNSIRTIRLFPGDIKTICAKVRPYLISATVTFQPNADSNTFQTFNYIDATTGILNTNKKMFKVSSGGGVDTDGDPVEGTGIIPIPWPNVLINTITFNDNYGNIGRIDTNKQLLYGVQNLFSAGIKGDICTSTSTITKSIVTKTFRSGSNIEPCLKLFTPDDQPGYFRRLVRLPQILGEDVLNGYSPVFRSESDPNWSEATFSAAYVPISFDIGDRLHIGREIGGNPTYLTDGEFTITQTLEILTNTGENTPTTSSVYLVLDREVPFEVVSGSIDNVLTEEPNICYYILLKKLEDETNIILEYNNLDNSTDYEGIVYPKYIKENIRKIAGNIIKSLKNENLI